MGKRLDKFTKAMEKIADSEADIIEAGGWGNKAEADLLRPEGGKTKDGGKKGK